MFQKRKQVKLQDKSSETLTSKLDGGSNGENQNLEIILSEKKSEPTVLSYGLEFEGNVICKEPIHVNGTLTGSIEGNLITIGSDGNVSGDVCCETVVIEGYFRGHLKCRDIRLLPNSSFGGICEYHTIEIACGSSIEGDLVFIDCNSPQK